MANRYDTLLRYVRALRPENIMEIGTCGGRSGVKFVRSAQKVGVRDVHYYGFDLWEDAAKEFAVGERPAKRASFAKAYNALRQVLPAESLHLYRGNTKSTLSDHVGDLPAMDFVFVDGGHDVATIASDWSYVRQLLHATTHVFFDDYIHGRRDFGAYSLVSSLRDDPSYAVDLVGPVDTFRVGRIQLALVKLQNGDKTQTTQRTVSS